MSQPVSVQRPEAGAQAPRRVSEKNERRSTLDVSTLVAEATAARNRQDYTGLLHCLDQLEGNRDGDALALWRADALIGLGRHEEALGVVATVLQVRPALAPGWVLVGEAQAALGLLPEADRAFSIALERDSGLAGAWLGRCRVAEKRQRWGDLVALAHQGVKAHTATATLWGALSRGLWMENQPMAAARAADHAAALDPSLARRWWAARVLPLAPKSSQQALRFRQRYGASLAALARDPSWGPGAEEAVWDAFPLHYQHDDVRREQQLLGRLLIRAVGGAPARPALPQLAAGERIRVGFVGSVLRRHTVSYLFSGWWEQLDPERFERFAVHLDESSWGSEALQPHFERWHHHPDDVAGAVRAIEREAPHVLIFPELGMDRRVLRIAARRLAPTQASTWGHPVTSGLPTVDAFLSSALMEPEHGDAHYSEQLVRLPGLGIHVKAPPLPPRRKGRRELGLPEEGPLWLVPQSLFKLRPEHDHLFAEVCAGARSGHLVLIANQTAQATEGVVRTVVERLTAAFAARGLRASEHLLVLPGQSWEDYIDLNRACDVQLDVPGWSGGRTTLEGLAAGLVPVTVAGPMMRQRHTAAILRKLGMEELIAPDHAAWVDKAVELARRPSKRRELGLQLADRLPDLWEDAAVVEALAAWLESCVLRR